MDGLSLPAAALLTLLERQPRVEEFTHQPYSLMGPSDLELLRRPLKLHPKVPVE